MTPYLFVNTHPFVPDPHTTRLGADGPLLAPQLQPPPCLSGQCRVDDALHHLDVEDIRRSLDEVYEDR